MAGSDPGYNRLITAARTVAGVAVVLGAEVLFVRLTGALEVGGGGTGLIQVAQQHHVVMVTAMLLGGMAAMVSGFSVSDPTPVGQVASMLVIPVPMVAGLAIGLSLGTHRFASLASFSVLMAFGGYCRRFGQRGLGVGLLLFIGDFIGFFLYGPLHFGSLGWLTAEIVLAVAVLVVMRLILFFPNRSKALRRSQRSYASRAARVATMALALFDSPDDRRRRRLQRQLVRLNESALMIDAQLGDPAALPPGSSALGLHQRLFDLELALTNIAHFAEAMSTMDLGEDRRAAVRQALEAVRAGHVEGAGAVAGRLLDGLRRSGAVYYRSEGRNDDVVVFRFAASVEDFATALASWRDGLAATNPGAGGDRFEPTYSLSSGWLPGSAQVSNDASLQPGPRRSDVRMPAHVRIALQMGVAVATATAVGDVVSSRRFYWAVLAAFIAFLGANNALEQIRKAGYRVLGTLIGIVAGSGVVSLVGGRSGWSLAAILVSLFFGIYLFRINYTFMVIAITIVVSQLYVQFDEFSHSLLLLRLYETAVGSVIAMLTVLLVVPLRSRRVLGVALAHQLGALATLVGDATARLSTPGASPPLHNDARAVDFAYQALLSTAQPLRWTALSHLEDKLGTAMAVAGGARNYGRNLVADVHDVPCLDARLLDVLKEGHRVLQVSLATLAVACAEDRGGTYVRSAPLFGQIERAMEDRHGAGVSGQLAMRDLQLLDSALGRLAEVLGLDVTNATPVAVP